MHYLTHSTIIETDNVSIEIIETYINPLIGGRDNNPDYFELKITDRQSIGVREVKEMIKWLQMKPFQSVNKVAVILEAERLTIEAQNSLLKTLEEPPKNNYIFLITSNHKALLQTIISRAGIIRVASGQLKNPSENTVADILNTDIQTQLKWIDSIYNSKDPIGRKAQIQLFLENVYNYTKQQTDLGTKKQNLELIVKTLEGLRRNVNIKLLLENFLFNYKKYE